MRHLMPVIAAAAVVLSTGSAYADLGDQLFKLLPDDGAKGHQFGRSVAISGATAIVGANGHDDNGSAPGSAYLFDTTTGRQIDELLANDGAFGDNFGVSVAISGATAIVGAWFDDDNGFWSGSAYLFDTTTSRQIAKLLADDGAALDLFGASVAINGATAIVGAAHDDDNGAYSGSAYLFDTTTGKQIAKLLPNDGAALDLFGGSVAISGATAIVGANGDDNNGIDSGAAYLFDTSTGRQIAKLLPDDGAANDHFGASVAISGPPGKQVAIVGAYLDDDNGASSGSAYLFDTTTGKQIAKLLANDGAELDFFGDLVAISGTIAIVGAPLDDDNGLGSGSAYLFDVADPANPTQLLKLLPDDGAASEIFGVSVAINSVPRNETAVVGAWQDDDNGDLSGSAYLFDTTTGRQIAKLLAIDGAADDRFGISVAISGATAIVGAYRDDDNGTESGSAYLFAAAGTGVCLWDLDGTGTVGILDLLALLAAWGSDPGGPPDFDGDGTVGIVDLLALLANWGWCP